MTEEFSRKANEFVGATNRSTVKELENFFETFRKSNPSAFHICLEVLHSDSINRAASDSSPHGLLAAQTICWIAKNRNDLSAEDQQSLFSLGGKYVSLLRPSHPLVSQISTAIAAIVLGQFVKFVLGLNQSEVSIQQYILFLQQTHSLNHHQLLLILQSIPELLYKMDLWRSMKLGLKEKEKHMQSLIGCLVRESHLVEMYISAVMTNDNGGDASSMLLLLCSKVCSSWLSLLTVATPDCATALHIWSNSRIVSWAIQSVQNLGVQAGGIQTGTVPAEQCCVLWSNSSSGGGASFGCSASNNSRSHSDILNECGDLLGVLCGRVNALLQLLTSLLRRQQQQQVGGEDDDESQRAILTIMQQHIHASSAKVRGGKQVQLIILQLIFII